jgi:hypothetical protein
MDKVAMVEFREAPQVGMVVLIVRETGVLAIAATLLVSLSFNALTVLT